MVYQHTCKQFNGGVVWYVSCQDRHIVSIQRACCKSHAMLSFVVTRYFSAMFVWTHLLGDILHSGLQVTALQMIVW